MVGDEVLPSQKYGRLAPTMINMVVVWGEGCGVT
jgi:hypothetical protein